MHNRYQHLIHTRHLAIPRYQLTQLVEAGVENLKILLHATDPRTTRAHCAKHSMMLSHDPVVFGDHDTNRVIQLVAVVVKTVGVERHNQVAILHMKTAGVELHNGLVLRHETKNAQKSSL